MVARPRKERRWVIEARDRYLVALVVLASNVLGSGAVFVLASWVIPEGQIVDPAHVRLVNMLLFAAYLAVALPLGLLIGLRRFRLWIPHGVEPDEEALRRRERRFVLYGPARIVLVQAALWLGAAVLFFVFNLSFSPQLSRRIGETVLLGGLGTAAFTYLVAERALRRTAERVLRDERMPAALLPGVVVRSLLCWALGSAVPVIGMMMAAASVFTSADVTVEQLAVIELGVGALVVVAGFVVTIGAAWAVADPMNAVRKAMARVERGDLSTTVPVYDGTEVGQLQAGFNTMVQGLRERERLRDLFGRQVGRDVATAAEEAGEVRLGGEVREVAVLFVDVVGSTALAATAPPDQVVAVLNRFFAVVVGTVEEHSGWINKFEGDAALAVFGAPVALPDPAGAALATARALAERLAQRLPDIKVGIGVSAGEAVAGYVGDVRRYEYTVIGDPVNEAARLTDVAKSTRGRVVASARAVECADDEEAQRWRLGRKVTLRGRNAPTRLATPKPVRSAPRDA